MKKSYEMDMCSGPLLSKILIFSIPLMISGILQLLFNAADIVVVGRFTGSEAMAAVGSTGALINLIINLFVGISVGANVVVARNYGARDYDGVHGAVHTSVLTALIGGVFLIFVGIALARPLLELMGTPDNVIDQSVLYMRIYFVGMPQRLFEPVLCHRVPHGRCGRRAGNHHFPDRFGDSGSAVPDEDGGPLPSGL